MQNLAPNHLLATSAHSTLLPVSGKFFSAVLAVVFGSTCIQPHLQVQIAFQKDKDVSTFLGTGYIVVFRHFVAWMFPVGGCLLAHLSLLELWITEAEILSWYGRLALPFDYFVSFPICYFTFYFTCHFQIVISPFISQFVISPFISPVISSLLFHLLFPNLLFHLLFHLSFPICYFTCHFQFVISPFISPVISKLLFHLLFPNFISNLLFHLSFPICYFTCHFQFVISPVISTSWLILPFFFVF